MCIISVHFKNKNMFFSPDFQKLGGFQVIIPGLTSEHKTLRCKTSELISTVVQHNAYCQDKFMEEPKFIDLLIDLVKNDLIDEVRIKSLHAISSKLFVICYCSFLTFEINIYVIQYFRSCSS